MPSEKYHHAYQFLDKKEWLSFEEIIRLTHIFVGLGVKKIRLTGGEPLLRPNLDVLIRELSAIQGVDDLALTTNGSMLKELASRLKNAGLSRLTVSLDSLEEKVFYQMSGERCKVEDVLEGISVAKQVGFESIKINTVVQRGINDHTVLDLVKFFRGTKHTVRFIEYMDVGNQNHWEQKYVVPSSELVETINKHFPLELKLSTQGGDTAEVYRFKDGLGEVGFVSSVTKAFCGTCNRLRLSADGKLYTCLFASQGANILELLRSGTTDQVLAQFITDMWNQRTDRYSQLRQQSPTLKQKVEMYYIGG